MRLAIALIVSACGGSPSPVANHAAATPDDRAYLVGIWTSSTASYAAATTASDAVRLGGDGTLRNGTWAGDRFSATASGPSPDFVAHFEVEPTTHTIRFHLDGADEAARYAVEPPDRWRTDTTSGEPITVYYVRRP